MLSFINDILWSYIVLILLVACALYFTIRLKGVQFTMLRDMFKQMKFESHDGQISGFHAFAVSLSSRVGTGNLAGVASAIFIGGPGAIFWMWIMAILGSATAFVEATLAQLYKKRGEDSFYGGPAYYMQQGLHCRWMGILFAILITITFGMANQIVQSNTMCDALGTTSQLLLGDELFNIHFSLFSYKLVIGVILAIATLVIIFGGIQRISRFSAIVVPIMAVGYLILSVAVILMNLDKIPGVLTTIVEDAFGVGQFAGGAIGMTIVMGVKRGLFSNEAGEGSAPNAAAIAHTTHPVKQGLLQALGVYTDTLLICTCTAFIILIAGLYDSGADGIILTTNSLESEVGVAGRYFITAAIFLFAYSSVIANNFYGETNIRFITKSKWVLFIYRLITGGVVFAGAIMALETAFDLVDICMGIMTITNLIAIFLLSRKAIRLLQDYRAQRKVGQDPVFHKDILTPEEQRDIECWE